MHGDTGAVTRELGKSRILIKISRQQDSPSVIPSPSKQVRKDYEGSILCRKKPFVTDLTEN